jgi:hypothetical protein
LFQKALDAFLSFRAHARARRKRRKRLGFHPMKAKPALAEVLLS